MTKNEKIYYIGLALSIILAIVVGLSIRRGPYYKLMYENSVENTIKEMVAPLALKDSGGNITTFWFELPENVTKMIEREELENSCVRVYIYLEGECKILGSKIEYEQE